MVNLLSLKNSQDEKKSAYFPLFSQRTEEKQPVESPFVLVIENHDDTRYLLKTLLERRGYLVAEASDGEQALHFFENAKLNSALPDLVLLETVLPGQDGLAVMRALRAFNAFASVPVVFLSSRAEASLKSEALKLGGNDFLVKPIELDFLEQTLDKYLAKSINQPPKSHSQSINGGFAG